MKIISIISIVGLAISSLAPVFAESNATFITSPVKVIEVDEITDEVLDGIIEAGKPVLLKGAVKNSPYTQMTWDEIKERYGHMETHLVRESVYFWGPSQSVVDEEKRQELLIRHSDCAAGPDHMSYSKNNYPEGNLPCYHAECTMHAQMRNRRTTCSFAHTIDLLQEFDQYNTALDVRVLDRTPDSIEHDSETDLGTLLSRLRVHTNGFYRSYSPFTLSHFDLFKTQGYITPFHRHGASFLVQFKGKKIALLTEPQFFMKTSHYDKKNYRERFAINLKICSDGDDENCCIPYNTLIDHIFNNLEEAKKVEDFQCQDDDCSASSEPRDDVKCRSATIHHAIIEPGDVLYFPANWDHHVGYFEGTSLGLVVQ